MRKAKKVENPSFIHKGAIALLIVPFLSWGGITLVGAVENIAILKVKNTSQKELILRVDNKIDRQASDLKVLDEKLDLIILRLNTK